MKRTIGLGLMVLSVYLCNSSACFAGNKLSVNSAKAGIENYTQSQLVVVMSARDEQSGDCIRKGNCKD
ncbi:hypothetical protein MEN41_07855 [Dolichospermum sp. ST_con]|nr:hypothetical protein [Dolichospermum sp. ST_con]MDD1417792.1 hypothetical protein [Dolichospermum sp. ST_sed1]MDD1426411.1 hypothetical protein [Dolichospermum sp. ST_sed9]MDD1432949.1 hypothetical protein [Dolichospermum sp. ST_sed6]MDD1435449.1 hypothetical protein [Dolichospermum sp. ST_sed10]MDD1442360.1 hypothetical protein [Dolichospermum sp. ST_sed3]MDD1447979.1 hypothetical protein [Dolichospermum sp. ST_sed8]MDD1455317.1 hypothetical protein [Dolichospermum sp. ST_sed7]MDD146213